MSCKSAIYLQNSGVYSVTEGNTIPLGNVIRRFGQNTQVSGSGIALGGCGYYKVTATFTIVPTAVGVVGVSLTNAGTTVSSNMSYASTASEPVSLTVVSLVRIVCDSERGFLEFVLSNGSGSVAASNVVVEKI